MGSLPKTQPRRSGARNEKIFGDKERKRPAVIPLIVQMIKIRVEPLPVVVAVHIEHVRVAVGIVRYAVRATTH